MDGWMDVQTEPCLSGPRLWPPGEHLLATLMTLRPLFFFFAALCSDCDFASGGSGSLDSLPWRPCSTTDGGFICFHSTLLLLGAAEPSGPYRAALRLQTSIGIVYTDVDVIKVWAPPRPARILIRHGSGCSRRALSQRSTPEPGRAPPQIK